MYLYLAGWIPENECWLNPRNDHQEIVWYQTYHLKNVLRFPFFHGASPFFFVDGWMVKGKSPHGPDAFMVDAPGRRVGSFCRAWRFRGSKTRVDLIKKKTSLMIDLNL